MNEITIKVLQPLNTKSVYKKQKVYRVYLGKDNAMIFSNKQDAENYASMVSKNVNQFIRISNIVFADLFKLYRTVWPGMDYATTIKINGYCEAINHNFTIIYQRDSSTAFETCYSNFKTLQLFCECLDQYLKRKKMYLHLYELNTIEATLNSNSMGIQVIKSRMKN